MRLSDTSTLSRSPREILSASCWLLLIFAASLDTSHAHTKDAAPALRTQTQVDSALAKPAAVVTLAYARFTVLTSRLIRMEWSADGHFEDHASLVFINRRLPVPKFSHLLTSTGGSQQLVLDTGDLKLTYTPGSQTDGRFTAETLQVALTLNGQSVSWHPGMPDSGNLLGTTRTLDGARGDKTKEPIEPGLISRDGWTIVDDSTRPLFDSAEFNFTNGEKSPWPWVMQRPSGDRQDLYFFGYGHDYKQALGDYVRVAGRIPLPPRFAFGAWWSRYWAYTDQELDDIVKGFRQNGVPLDVLVIDMDWHTNRTQLEAAHEVDQSTGHSLGWSGYSWNKVLFPDPDLFLKHLHQEGLKATLNLHPASGVQSWEAAYPAMARAMDIDPSTKKYVPFDITNKQFAANYMKLLHHPLEKQGIDFWWLDWQQEPNTQMAGVSPTWWLNYVHFTDQQREGKRPLLFHRWGGLGNHRYQIGFSGDTISVWESLAFQPWFTATAANVGYAYWSHDIGGHMPGAVDPEIYTRWIQFGAFSPILRTHTTKNPESERRIWAYPEPYADIMRDTFRLRYSMEPYVYTEARRTYDTGVAFFRPLYYEWPEAEPAYTNKSEYLFGEEMIVAPITAPVDAESQLALRSVWIPPGEWIETATGKHFTGPVQIERKFSISQIPVYARAGSIVPMQPDMQYTGEKPVNPLILNVQPLVEGQTSSYTLYEDASDSEAYKQGVFARTRLSGSQKGDDLEVEIDPVQGHYPGMPQRRAYEIILPGDWPPDLVTLNGRALPFERRTGQPGWHYEGNTLTTIIAVPPRSVAEDIKIHIRRPAGSIAKRAALDGFAGAMARFHNAYNALNEASSSGAPDPLIVAMQTGDRLSYHPETAQAEIAQRKQASSDAIDSIQTIVTKFEAPEENPGNGSQREMPEQHARYQLLLHRALIQAQDAAKD